MDAYRKLIHQMLSDAAAAARKTRRSYIVLGDPDNIVRCGWGFLTSYVGPDSIRVCSDHLSDVEDVYQVTAVGNDVTVTQVKRDGAWIGEFSTDEPRLEGDPKQTGQHHYFGKLFEEVMQRRKATKTVSRDPYERARRILEDLPDSPWKLQEGKIDARDVIWPAPDPSKFKLFDIFRPPVGIHPSTQESRDFLRAERGDPTTTQADEIRALRAWVRHGAGWFDDPNGEEKK